MPSNDVLGDPGPTVMLGTEDDDIRAQLVASPKNDVRDVVLGGVDEFSVDGDSRRGEVVDGVLHYLPFAGGDIVLAVEDAEPGSGVDVVGDDVTARDV